MLGNQTQDFIVVQRALYLFPHPIASISLGSDPQLGPFQGLTQMLAHSAQTILLDSALKLWLARAWELEVASSVSSKQISRRKLVAGFPVVSVVGSVGPHSSCDFAG